VKYTQSFLKAITPTTNSILKTTVYISLEDGLYRPKHVMM
jgi:hypothetical protein